MSISGDSDVDISIHKIAATNIKNVKSTAGDKNNVYLKLSFGDIWHSETDVQKAAGANAIWHFEDDHAHSTDMQLKVFWKDLKKLPLAIMVMDANTYTPHKLIGSGESMLSAAEGFEAITLSASASAGGLHSTELHLTITVNDEHGAEAGSVDIGLRINLNAHIETVNAAAVVSHPHSLLEKAQSFSQGEPSDRRSGLIHATVLNKAHSLSYVESSQYSDSGKISQPNTFGHPHLGSNSASEPIQGVLAKGAQKSFVLPTINESLFQATVEVSIGGSSIVSILNNLQMQINELKNRPVVSGGSGISADMMDDLECRMENMLNQRQAETMAEMERRMQEMLKEKDDTSLEFKFRQLTKRVQDLEDANGEGILVAIQTKFGGRIESLEQRMSKLEKTVAANLVTRDANNGNEEDAQMGSRMREQLDRLKAVEAKVEGILDTLPAVEGKVAAVEETVDSDHQQVTDLAKRVSRLGDSYSVCDARIAELYELLNSQMEDLGKLQALMEALPDECLDKLQLKLQQFDATKANRTDLNGKADISLLLSKADQSDLLRLNELASDLGSRISHNKLEVKENLESLASNTDKKLEAMGSWILKLLRRGVPDDSHGGGTDIGKVRCLVCDSTSKQHRNADVGHGGPGLSPHGKTLRRHQTTSSAPTVGFGTTTVNPSGFADTAAAAATAATAAAAAAHIHRDTSAGSRMNSSPLTSRRPMPQEPGSTLAQGRPRSANSAMRISSSSAGIGTGTGTGTAAGNSKSRATMIHRSSLEIPPDIATRITNPDTAAKLSERIADARVNGRTDHAFPEDSPPSPLRGVQRATTAIAGETSSPTSRLIAIGQPLSPALVDLDDSAIVEQGEGEGGFEMLEYIAPPHAVSGRPTVFELAAQNTQKQREESETYFKDLDARFHRGAGARVGIAKTPSMRPATAPPIKRQSVGGGPRLQGLGRPVQADDDDSLKL